jgi:hypothetical protein
MDIAIVLIGIVLIIYAFVFKPTNALSSIVFNVFFFFSGAYAVFYGMHNMGIVSIVMPS